MQGVCQAENYRMTPESITAYIRYEQDRGASNDSIRNFKRVTNSLYEWLPGDKSLTKDLLLAWRQDLKAHGYTQQTELNYVKGINRYLDYIDCSHIRFNRGKAKNIAGKEFGYLTAIEPTGEKYRKDYIWRCVCRCGKEVTCPATRLLTGNTASCGCLRGEHLRSVNKYIGGTSLRQSMEEQIHSTRSRSGYTGVTVKRGKWLAYIKYKGQSFSLGCYSKLEDAVQARAKAKELVQMDAMGLLDFYEEIHKDDPARPSRQQIREAQKAQGSEPYPKPESRALRSNNTSGCPGVFRKRDKWAAKITHNKVTYQLGTYESIEQAVSARREAEHMLRQDPKGFSQWAAVRRHRKQETK